MPSFFEKLKKGMGIEVPSEKEIEERAPELKPIQKEKKPKKEGKLPSPAVERISLRGVAGQIKKIEIKSEEKPSELPKVEEVEKKEIETKKEKWFEAEGELAIDVYQTEEEIVIQSTIAGLKPEDLDISIENGVVTIKGSRERPGETGERDYFYQECYWGPFSRKIILPEETDPSRVEATMKEGILTIRIPKIQKQKKRKILVRG